MKTEEFQKDKVAPITTPPALKLYYKVQLFSSKSQLKLTDSIFIEYPNIEVFYSRKWYKYASGIYASYDEANSILKKIKVKYPDAFIIAVKEGQIIPMGEAKHLLN
jgi:N-acetylmuramoyl-L-alanine amidase